MPMLRKTYRFRLRPTKAQEQALARMAGARRFAWNWALARRKEHYAETGRSLSWVEQSAELTLLRRQPGMEWMLDIPRVVFAQALRDIDRTFAAFFERCRLKKLGIWKGKLGFPRFKSRKRDQARFRIPENVKILDGRISVPRVGQVRLKQTRLIDGKLKSATYKRDASGRWHVMIVVEFEMPVVAVPVPSPERTIGIDLGLIDFATLSDGSDPIPAPKFFRKAQRKLRRAQRVVSRRSKGSNRRAKAKLRVAKIHQRIGNQRGDFLHKLTTRLVNDHDGICIEDLSLKGLARTKLAKSFHDAAMGEFRQQIEYKAEWNRKTLVVVGRFFPSSKTCNACGAVNDTLTLSDRHWVCGCGAVHDRDRNAARNIRDEGLRMLAAGNTESLNARGARVRPSKEGSGLRTGNPAEDVPRFQYLSAAIRTATERDLAQAEVGR